MTTPDDAQPNEKLDPKTTEPSATSGASSAEEASVTEDQASAPGTSENVVHQPTAAARPAGKGKKEKGKKKEGLWQGTVKPILEVVVVVFLFRALIVDWNDVPSGSMLPTIQIGDRIAVNRLAYGLNLPVPFLRHDKEGKGFLDLPFTTATVPMPLPGQIIRWSDPERGDIVIVWSPQEDGPLGTRLVKRVVAVPGDTVEIKDGELYINGERGQYDPIDGPYVQTADRGRTREVQSYMEKFPAIDFEHVIQYPMPFQPGIGTDLIFAQQPGLANSSSFGDLYNMSAVTLADDEYMCMGDNRMESNDGRVFGPVSRKQIVGRAFAVAFSFKGGKMTKPDFSRFFKGLD